MDIISTVCGGYLKIDRWSYNGRWANVHSFSQSDGLTTVKLQS